MAFPSRTVHLFPAPDGPGPDSPMGDSDPEACNTDEFFRRLRRRLLVPVGVSAVCFLAALLVLRMGIAGDGEAREASLSQDGGAEGLVMDWVAPTETETTTYTTTEPLGPHPTLFCWSHMQPNSSEVSLLRLQLVKRASIFACNFQSVISTHKYLLGNIGGADVWTWVNPSAPVTMGQNGVDGATTDSFLNTATFLAAWDTLMNSKQMWPYDFVVKVDPDAVFFPDRLREHVRAHKGDTVYFSNCGKYGGQVLLYGSVEVFSREALMLYEQHVAECKALPWQKWGEDYYIQKCLDQLGVTNIGDTNMVADERCVGAPCSDYQHVAFHDFKTPETWYKCFQEAVSR